MIYKITPLNTRLVYAPDGEAVEIPVDPNTSMKLKGAWIPVTISLSTSAIELIQPHEKQLQSFNCEALIDTGASMSVISPKVAEQLHLVETGYEHISSVHSTEVRPAYFARVTFPWGSSMEIPLVCCELQGFDCLIRRDVLRNWHVTYNGFNGEITICD